MKKEAFHDKTKDGAPVDIIIRFSQEFQRKKIKDALKEITSDLKDQYGLE